VKLLAFLVVLLHCSAVSAQEREVGFDAYLVATVHGDVAFREARLGDYYGQAPVVLVLGYLGCVNLCGTTLNGVAEALRRTALIPERDYTALFVSVDPRDEKAAAGRRSGWHFLTGAAAAARVARTVGFRYSFEKESGQFAHPAGFVVLTPEGKVAQYFEGVRFDPGKLRETLLAARRGETQSSFQRLLFVCFHDPLGGRNTPAVMSAVRIVMAMLLVGAGFFAWRRLR